MLTIVKRNGRTEPLDITKIQKYTSAAVKGLMNVSHSKIDGGARKELQNILNIFQEISKYDIAEDPNINQVIEYLEHNPEFMLYFKRWERHKRNGKVYNHSLFEMLRSMFILSNAYSLLKNHFDGSKWERCQKSIKQLFMANLSLGVFEPRIKSLVDFAFSFEPKQYNRYIAKIMITAGLTLEAVKNIFAVQGGMTRITEKILNKIKLPKLPFTYYSFA